MSEEPILHNRNKFAIFLVNIHQMVVQGGV